MADADARLRSIERDLHDGTQARLVAVAMQLGEAREHLADGGDVGQAAELVDTAHSSTKEALTELRELARGIHPPALDSGLAVALETLAARRPCRCTVDIDPGWRRRAAWPRPSEPIAYFTRRRARHQRRQARPRHGGVRARRAARRRGLVRIRVRDDGRGGAGVVPPDGSGLRSGLAASAERVRSVDGTSTCPAPSAGLR